MTTAADTQIVPRQPAACRRCAPPTGAWPTPWSPSSPTTPAASTAPSGASSPAGATRCGLRSLPAEPLTVARYLAARAGSGASIATLRLATSAISEGPRVGRSWNPPAGTRACAPL